MSSFVDAVGREWKFQVTVGQLSAAKSRTGFDLGKILQDPDALGSLLFGDPIELGELLWFLVGEQATARGIDRQSFECGLDGPALERANESLIMAIAELFPRAKMAGVIRDNLRSFLAKVDERACEAISKGGLLSRVQTAS